METQHQHHEHKMPSHNNMYKKFAFMIVISFIVMYILMYSMVDRFANVIPNINQFYMVGLMTTPMILIELLVMGRMYKNRKLNIGILAVGFIALISFYLCIRQQAAVRDKQFLKSMIPHHAAAILMVEEAKLTDPEVQELTNNIISAQQREIVQMKAKIKELEK